MRTVLLRVEELLIHSKEIEMTEVDFIRFNQMDYDHLDNCIGDIMGRETVQDGHFHSGTIKEKIGLPEDVIEVKKK